MSIKQGQISGIVGMASAVLWLVALTIEHAFGLFPPGNGTPLYVVDQLLFLAALLGYVILLAGLWQVRAAGDGVFGKISLGLFITGLVALAAANVAQLIIHDPNFFLFPIGGLLQLLGGLLTGIAVVAARRWDGWQRFAPLVQGLYYLIVLFIPVIVTHQAPSQLAESLWQVAWFLTSLALYTQSSRAPSMVTD